MGTIIYCLTTKLRKKSDIDVFYFALPYLYFNVGNFLTETKQIFEKGFPPNQTILKMRQNVIRTSAYDYPAIIKNEIEYLHFKLHGFDQDESLLEKP